LVVNPDRSLGDVFIVSGKGLEPVPPMIKPLKKVAQRV
jgi:hypothetical protein